MIAILVFLAVEVQTQTQLWSATLTTGSNTALPTWFGWDVGGAFSGGTLDDVDFVFDVETYRCGWCSTTTRSPMR